MDELRDLLNEYDDSISAPEPEESPGGPAVAGEKPSGSGGRQGRHSSSNSPDDGGNVSDVASETGSYKAKPFPRKRNYLNTDHLVVSAAFPASIHEIVKELSAINIQRFPNATLDLLRTFLEKTVKAYAEVLGEEIRKKSNDQGFVYLSNCLIWLEEHFKSTGQTAYIQTLQKIRGERYGFVGSKAHLDATNHNHHIFATPDDVRECWTTIEGVIRAVLKK
jgi:hypothetical protein